MQFTATQKFTIVSPRKLRPLADVIKKLSPQKAIETLPFTGKRASSPLAKVINTALANAKQKDISPDSLFIKEIQIGEGPQLKRGKAVSRGRSHPYKKRMSHIRVVLETRDTDNTKKATVKAGDESKKSESKSEVVEKGGSPKSKK